MSVLNEILQERDIALGRHLVAHQFRHRPPDQIAVIAPLATGMAAQIAEIGEPDADLADARAIAVVGNPQVEQQAAEQ